MEQAIRGLSTPDVIKSALDNKNEGTASAPGRTKISTNAIDNLFGVPEKIAIPERYIPDTVSTLNSINKNTDFLIISFCIGA